MHGAYLRSRVSVILTRKRVRDPRKHRDQSKDPHSISTF